MKLFGCSHGNFSTPRCGWQRCFSCGARRRYETFGSKPGPWTKEPEPVIQYNAEVRELKRIFELNERGGAAYAKAVNTPKPEQHFGKGP